MVLLRVGGGWRGGGGEVWRCKDGSDGVVGCKGRSMLKNFFANLMRFSGDKKIKSTPSLNFFGMLVGSVAKFSYSNFFVN